jgi:hypothetical protein
MSSTSEFMAEVSLAHSYPELFQVTEPLPSLVLRTEDMWRRHNQCHRSLRGSQSGFPLLTPNVPFQGFARQCGIQVFKLYSTPSPVTEDRNVDL